MRVALNGLFLDSPTTGTGQYVRHLLAAAPALASSEGVDLVPISPTGDPSVARAIVAPPRMEGNLGKVEFEHITFPQACTSHRFDLAHVPHFGPPLFPSIPTVITVHDLIPIVLPEYRGPFAVRLYTWIAAMGARRATTIIVDSEASRTDIVARLHIPFGRVHVVYLAADERFCANINSEELTRVRAKYRLADNFILYLGGFDVRKNVRVLVDSFGALNQQERAGWKLVIAGRLPDRVTALFPDPRFGADRDVMFIGQVNEDDKPALYASAGIFAYPSRYEGFGLPPLEAMACGTPVLCSSAGSLPEVVGEGGKLVDPMNKALWADALRRLIANSALRRELSDRAQMQSAKFSWSRTARETFAVYRSAVSAQSDGLSTG